MVKIKALYFIFLQRTTMAKVTNPVHHEAEEDFATLLQQYEEETQTTSVLYQGTIVEIKDDETFIDINDKTEGILKTEEITKDGKLIFNVGDKIQVATIGSRGGRKIVSYLKALRKEKIANFIENYKENEENIIDVKIIGKNRGGFICVNNDDVEFFMPRSQIKTKDNNLIGKQFKVKIFKVDKENGSIVVSRTKILDEERKKRKEILSKFQNNEEAIEGTVTKIVTYGMIVDIGGIDGLVHCSEISYKGQVNPSSLYNVGDKVYVKIINQDKDKKSLSLSIKAAMPDPWDEIKDSLEIGDTIRVTVSNIEHYGAFVDLGNDIEGFLHISEIAWDKNIKNPKLYIKEGEEIEVEVIEINVGERRLRVSLKNLTPKPFDVFAKSHKVNDVVEGEISTITNFGAFVKIGNIEGLLHNEDASWVKNEKCKDLFTVGQKIKVKIIKIDTENSKVSLSYKENTPSPMSEYAKNHSQDDIVSGEILDIKDFGVFVKLDENIDALIRKEDLGNINLEDLKVGDKIDAAIAHIDEAHNKIRLSVRRLSSLKEREVLKQINNDEKITIGDIIKDQLS